MQRSALFLISAMVVVIAVRGMLFGNIAPSIFAQQGSSGNLAAATNGGTIIAYSSEYTPGWEASDLIDGDYTKGWGTNAAVAAGQWIVVRLPGEAPATIHEIHINPGPVAGDTPPMGLKDFRVEVSTDDVTYTTAGLLFLV